jgi:two-component system sensor histidine kinase YesM
MVNKNHKYKKTLHTAETLFSGAFTIVIAVVIGALSLISYFAAARELERNLSMYQQALLAELNKQISLQRNTIEQISLSALRNIRIISYDLNHKNAYERRQSHQDLEYYLANITYSAPIIHSIYMYMDPPAMASLLNAVHFYDIQLLKEYGWYAHIENTEFTWISERVIQSNQNDLRVIGFARKITDSWPYNGVMIFNVKISDIEQLLNAGGKQQRMLFDSDNKLIASVGIKNADDDSFAAMIGEILDNRNGYSAAARSNRKYLTVYDTDPSGWTLLEITLWEDIMRGSRRLVFLLVIIGLMAIIAASFLVFQLKQQYRQHNTAEMKTLQAMINPHFLYNTLDQINWMAIDAGQADISKALSLVGKMFRIGLSHGEALSSVEDEIAHVSCYLELQKLRWKDRLEYTITCDPCLAACQIPRLIIQPIVENSIIHGFHNRGNGNIDISFSEKHDDLVILIRDNGIGIAPDWQEQILKRNMSQKKNVGGYGLQNVIKRIEILCQKTDSVHIQGVAGKGTTVTLRFPL